jgi:hypothetical protein
VPGYWQTLTPVGKGIVAGAPVVLAVLAWFLVRGGGETSDPAVTTGANPAGPATPVVAELPPIPHPAQVSSADGSPALPPLPSEDSIFAWFSGAKAALGRDYRTPAKKGDQVAAWVNLVSNRKELALLRDSGDPKGEHLPRLVESGAAQIAGIRGTHRGLTTTNRSSLSMLKHDVALPDGITIALVAELEAGDDRIYRFQAPTWDNRYFQLSTSYDGKVNIAAKGAGDGTEQRVSVPWRSGDLGIFVHRWNPAANEQRLTGINATGATPGGRPVEAKGAITFSGSPLTLMMFGKRGFGDGYDAVTNNVVYEIVIYDRVLSDDETKAVSEALAKRYFSASP